MEEKTESLDKMIEIVDTLVQNVNHFDYEDQAHNFFVALSRQHRTLQQNFWRMISKVVDMYGKTEFKDARNEHSVKWCKAVIRHTTSESLNYFPTV